MREEVVGGGCADVWGRVGVVEERRRSRGGGWAGERKEEGEDINCRLQLIG